MIKHTPGPWRLQPRGSDCWEIVTDETDDDGEKFDRAIVDVRPLADVYPDDVHFEDGRNKWMENRQLDDTDKANARLIAAAPDLLEACWAMVTSFHAVEWMEEHMRESTAKARAAIAKATGEA